MKMMSRVAVLFALLGASYSHPLVREVRDEPVDTANQWIHCVHLALETGLEEAGIPPHNPLVLSENLTLEIDLPIVGKVVAGFPHVQIDGILNYNFTQLEGETVTDENGTQSVVLNYTIYWPDMNINGIWELIEEDNNGTFAIHIEHTTFSGIWDMVTSGQDVPRQMNNVTLDINVEEVEANIPDIPLEGLNEAAIAEAVKLALNGIPTSLASELLKERLDTFWLGTPERIDAIIDNCKNNGSH